MKNIGLHLLFLGVMLGLHLYFPSMLNGFGGEVYKLNGLLSDEFIQATRDYHGLLPAFARRPLMSFSLDGLRFFGIGYALAFTILGFAGVFMSARLVQFLGTVFGLTKKAAHTSVCFFYLSFTIFFAFFGPIYSYDDFFQYIFLFLSLYFLHVQRYVLFILIFFFALVARETSIILLPAMVFFCTTKDNIVWSFSGVWLKVLLCIFPTLLYLLFLFLFLQQADMLASTQQYIGTERFIHWEFNFQNKWFLVETVCSVLLPLAFPTLLLWYYAKYSGLTMFEKRLTYTYLFTLIINTIIVLITARAREARLFSLPLIFLWPLMGKYILQVWALWPKAWGALKNSGLVYAIANSGFVTGLTMLGVFFLWKWYQPTAGWGFESGYRLYACFTVFLCGSLILFARFLQKKA